MKLLEHNDTSPKVTKSIGDTFGDIFSYNFLANFFGAIDWWHMFMTIQQPDDKWRQKCWWQKKRVSDAVFYVADDAIFVVNG